MVAVHEMGHQRAALTHPHERFEDHWPEGNTTGYACVMHLMTPGMTSGQVEAILANFQFCGYLSDHPNVRSCVRFNYERGL
jgi:hypothetical protein